MSISPSLMLPNSVQRQRAALLEFLFWLALFTVHAGVALSLFRGDISLVRLVLQNGLAPEVRDHVLHSVGIVGMAVAAVSLVYISWVGSSCSNDSIEERILTCSKCLQGGILLLLLGVCTSVSVWHASPGPMVLILLGALALLRRWLIALECLDSGWLKKVARTLTVRRGAVLSALLCAAIGSYFAYYTVINHWRFGTAAFDLGFIVSGLASTLRGTLMSSSFIGGSSTLSIHFALTHLIPLPFFALFPYSETVLIVQSFGLALAAVPLYFLSVRVSGSALFSTIMVVIFLLHPANHTALFHDFNELAFLPLALFSLYYFIEIQNRFLFVVALVCALGVKNDMPFLLLPGALLVASRAESPFFVATLIGGSLAWIGVSSALMELLGGDYTRYISFFASSQPPEMSGPAGLATTLVMNPLFLVLRAVTVQKLLYIAIVFVPLLFTPFRSLRTAALSFYGLAVTLLANASHWPVFSINFQYVWYLIPTAILGTVYAVGAGCSEDRRRVMILVVVSTVIVSCHYGVIFNRASFRGGVLAAPFNESDREKLRHLDVVTARIPRSASISADENIGPHLVEFSDVTTFRYFNRETDFLLLWDGSVPVDPHGVNLIDSGRYSLLDRQGPFLLFEKRRDS